MGFRELTQMLLKVCWSSLVFLHLHPIKQVAFPWPRAFLIQLLGKLAYLTLIMIIHQQNNELQETS